MHETKGDTMNRGPLVTTAALEEGTAGLREAFSERIQRDAENLSRVAALHFNDLIYQAYTSGLRDGFMQGTMAQAEVERASRAEGA